MARTPARTITTPVLQRLELSRVARVATGPVLPQETQDPRTNTSDFPPTRRTRLPLSATRAVRKPYLLYRLLRAR